MLRASRWGQKGCTVPACVPAHFGHTDAGASRRSSTIDPPFRQVHDTPCSPPTKYDHFKIISGWPLSLNRMSSNVSNDVPPQMMVSTNIRPSVSHNMTGSSSSCIYVFPGHVGYFGADRKASPILNFYIGCTGRPMCKYHTFSGPTAIRELWSLRLF